MPERKLGVACWKCCLRSPHVGDALVAEMGCSDPYPPKFIFTHDEHSNWEGRQNYEDFNLLANSLVKPGGMSATLVQLEADLVDKTATLQSPDQTLWP